MTSTVFVDKRAQRGIWDHWRMWKIATLDPDIETEMFRFNDWVKDARSQLLDWSFDDDDRHVDKWEVVHEWLCEYERKNPRM